MSRSIQDSITALESSLDNCKTSLEGKEVTVETRPKVSELPALIDNIQAGSGDNKYTVTITYYVGTVYDTYNDPNCKLRSQDKSLNYEPIKVRQKLTSFGDDSDEYDGYSYYTFEIPYEDITKPTVLELCDLDKSEEVVEYCEILNNGFWITYEPEYKLIKSDTDDHIGYLSDEVFTYGNKYKKASNYWYKSIFEIDIARVTIKEVGRTDNFELSPSAFNLITTTNPYLVYNNRLITSINQSKEGN